MKTATKKYISAIAALSIALTASGLVMPAFAADEISYIERSWDEETKTIKENTVTTSDYKDITSVADVLGAVLGSETYVVKGDVTFNQRLAVSGNTKLVLLDGSHLTCRLGIRTVTDNGVTTNLNIYGQTQNTGHLEATADESDKAGIGGDSEEYGGNVNIHGGKVIAKGGDDAAGIGGGYYRDGGNFTVYGGEVEATGGVRGAGIGGGFAGNGTRDDTEIKIYGGSVTATGGHQAAGIGGGKISSSGGYNGGCGGNIDVYGGEVTATGGSNAAGIGMGSSNTASDSSAKPSYLGWITITGGSVTAQGGKNGAGIGGGDHNFYYAGNGCVSIKGGTVTATGGDDGAGIGSGYLGFMVPVTISGGTVTAIGGNDAAGIGSENNPSGGTASLEITGGDVTVKGTNDGAGIGPGWTSFAFTRMSASWFTAKITGGRVHITTDDGWAIGTTGDSNDFNDKRYWCKLEIGNKMQVRSERAFQTVEKVAACRYRHEVYIEECDHRDTFGDSGISYEYKDSLVHSASCIYCGSKWSENHDAAGLNGACSKCASDNQLKTEAHCLYFAGPKDESDVPSAGFVGSLVAGDEVSVNTLTWTIHPNGMDAKEFTTQPKDHGIPNITLYKGARLNIGLIVKGVSDGVAEAELTAK